MNYINTRQQALDAGSQIIKLLQSVYRVSQSILDELGAVAEVLEGRKDPRDRRSGQQRRTSYGRRLR